MKIFEFMATMILGLFLPPFMLALAVAVGFGFFWFLGKIFG